MRSKGNRKEAGKLFYLALGAVAFFLAWWGAFAILQAMGNLILDSPFVIIGRVFGYLGESWTWRAIGYTLLRLLISFSASFLIGGILGLLGGLNMNLHSFLRPFVAFSRAFPTAALIVLFVSLFHPIGGSFWVVFLVIFPIGYETVHSGIANIDQDTVDQLKLECSQYDPRAVVGVLIPSAWPYILLGLVSAFGLGVKVSIMAELLTGVGTFAGLGTMIYAAQINADYDGVFAIGLIAMLIIGSIDLILLVIKSAILSQKGKIAERQSE